MKQKSLFTLLFGLLTLAAMPGRGDVTLTGDLVFDYDGYGALLVGNTIGFSDLNVTAGSSLAPGDGHIPGWGPGVIIAGNAQSSLGNGIGVSGAGSQLTCWDISVGDAGSMNHLAAIDGATLKTQSPDRGIRTGGAVVNFNNPQGVSSNNYVLVTGPGTLLDVGAATVGVWLSGTGDWLTLTNGGHITGTLGIDGANEIVQVSDSGTMWDLRSIFNLDGTNNWFTIRDGAQVIGTNGYVAGYSNALSLTGLGSSLILDATLNMSGYGIRLTVGSNTVVRATGLFIIGDNGSSGSGAITPATICGSVFVTNAAGAGLLNLYGGISAGGLTSPGRIVADQVSISDSSLTRWFHSGTLQSKGMEATTPAGFFVGDGTNMANYVMLGGTHTFNSGLVISSNSVLSGCGTVIGTVTNYGTIILSNGCDLVFSNAVVNFGTILVFDGTLRFQSTFINNGSLLLPQMSGLIFSGPDVLVQFNSVSNYLHEVQVKTNLDSGPWTSLTNGLLGTGGFMTILDAGGATNVQRFYRVRTTE